MGDALAGMTNQDRQTAASARLECPAYPRRRPVASTARRGGWTDSPYIAAYRRLLARHRRLIRRVTISCGVVAGLLLLAGFGLWWRLSSGPIELDAFTPWLVAAIEENFGSRERVEIGGTQIERTENGGAAVRVRDIVVRDPDGTVVASAPKAEIRVSGLSLLSGHMRAESLNLVGAEMSVRIEPDGSVTIFAAGGGKHPIATATVPEGLAPSHPELRQDSAADPRQRAGAKPLATAPNRNAIPRPPSDSIAALLTWIDAISQSGLDGHDLRELGLKDGSLTVDDERTGKRWSFQNITLKLDRPRGGGIVVTVGSDNPQRPWGITASIKPSQDGFRSIALEARQVAASDLLLAARLGDGSLQVNVPLSASLSGEIALNGVPQLLTGRVVADAGTIKDSPDDDSPIEIDRAEFKINWDSASRLLTVPFQVLAGNNRITLLGQVEAPPQAPGVWAFRIGGGSVVLNQPGAAAADALVLNRIALSGQFDPVKKRFTLDQGDVRNNDLGVAMSGSADYSSGELRLAAGVAATRMSSDALKRLWPVFVSPKVRDWFNEHLSSGTIERLDIGVNAPLETLKASGPPIPDDGLTVQALATNCVVRPVAGLPALHDADLTVAIKGRDAQVMLGKGTADLSSGRKLVLTAGLFEVPDTQPHAPPARVRFKLDGPVPAAAELLAMDRLRDASSVPIDPATSRGNLSAQVTLGMPLKADLPPGSAVYNIAVDATNFSADHMIMGQKVEAALLKATANNQGVVLKGDVKIAGTPASLEYRKMKADPDAEIHLQGMLDEGMRTTLGLDPQGTIAGSIPIQLNGRVGAPTDRDGRFSVEADLTPSQIDGFLPGWTKQSGKPARATFTLTTKPQSVRVEDLLIEGAGIGVKGTVDLDGSGDLVSANFPTYGFSDGDRASLKVDRTGDGALRVVMRGDAYDGRGLVKSMTGGPQAGQANKKPPPDIDLDMKIGAVLGHNGEALRGLEMKMSRRAGELRSLGVLAKIGRSGTLSADLRSRLGARQMVAIETSDAGALFRFVDIYSRMNGGDMIATMDPPSALNPTQSGSLSVRNFAVHDESQIERAVVQGGPQPPHPSNTMDFSGMKVNFVRSGGTIALHDGVVRGPVLGGTIDGTIDYSSDQVHLRGTLVPLYGANNLLGQLPVVGLFLGGEKEGLLGITYEVVGRPGNPVLHVNPLSALAPGLLRKVFEFPAAGVGFPAAGAGFPAVPPAMPDDNTSSVDYNYRDTNSH